VSNFLDGSTRLVIYAVFNADPQRRRQEAAEYKRSQA
jgi:hypothetical protein